MDKLFDRAVKMSMLYRTDLDNTTLGKQGYVTVPPMPTGRGSETKSALLDSCSYSEALLAQTLAAEA